MFALAGRHYTTTRPFLSLTFGAGGDYQRLNYCIDPAVKVFDGPIVGQDQIYVVCAIEPILMLPNSFLVWATLPKRQPRTYALSSYLNGADDSQGRHARAAAFRYRAKATSLFFRCERAHGDDKYGVSGALGCKVISRGPLLAAALPGPLATSAGSRPTKAGRPSGAGPTKYELVINHEAGRGS